MAPQLFEIRPEDLPPNAGPQLLGAIETLGVISRQFRVALGVYYMFAEFTRNRDFIKAVNRARLGESVRTIVGSLTRDLVVSIASFFDRDQRATNLNRVLNELLHEQNDGILRGYHASWPVPYNTDEGKVSLTKCRSSLNRQPVRDAIDRFRQLRSKAVAHIDLRQASGGGRPLVREIDLLMALAGIAIIRANLFATGRYIDARDTRDICRRTARSVADAIAAGLGSFSGSDDA